MATWNDFSIAKIVDGTEADLERINHAIPVTTSTAVAGAALAVVVSSNDKEQIHVGVTTNNAVNYTLPAAADMVGRTFRFVRGATNNAITVTAPGAIMAGYGVINAVLVDCVGATTATFTVANAVIGDYLEVTGLTATTIKVVGWADDAAITFA